MSFAILSMKALISLPFSPATAGGVIGQCWESWEKGCSKKCLDLPPEVEALSAYCLSLVYSRMVNTPPSLLPNTSGKYIS